MDKKDNRRTVFLFLALSFLSLLVFYLSRWSVLISMRSFFERPVVLLQQAVYGVVQRTRDRLSFVRAERSSAGEAAFEEQEKELLLKTGELATCLEENTAMRRLLGAPMPPAWHFIPAKIVGFYKRLKINVGRRAGVREGMMVVSESFLVGRVTTTTAFSSSVALVSDPTLKIPIVMRSPDGARIKGRGVLTGSGEQEMVVSELLKGELVLEGDLVFTSGEGEWLADILIGEVEEIVAGKEKVFQKAFVSSPVDFGALRHVFVVKVLGG
jgi:rod shape-determining protein MreC